MAALCQRLPTFRARRRGRSGWLWMNEVSNRDEVSMMAAMSARGPSTDVQARADAPPASPAANRPARSRWRDPRLVVGVAAGRGSVRLLGARLLGGADDTVGVWAARDRAERGQPVRAADLVRREVRFADQARRRPLPRRPTRRLPAGTTSPRRRCGGAAAPRGAVGSDAPAAAHRGAAVGGAPRPCPATVRVGSLVDVWVTPDGAATDRLAATGPRAPRSTARLRRRRRGLGCPRSGTSLGPTRHPPGHRRASTRTRRPGCPTSLAALASGTVVLTAQR